MMSERDDGGPAFPTMTDGGYARGGMSLRDWFAGQALPAVLMDTAQVKAVADRMGICLTDAIAEVSYEVADAMLAERKK